MGQPLETFSSSYRFFHHLNASKPLPAKYNENKQRILRMLFCLRKHTHTQTRGGEAASSDTCMFSSQCALRSDLDAVELCAVINSITYSRIGLVAAAKAVCVVR